MVKGVKECLKFYTRLIHPKMSPEAPNLKSHHYLIQCQSFTDICHADFEKNKASEKKEQKLGLQHMILMEQITVLKLKVQTPSSSSSYHAAAFARPHLLISGDFLAQLYWSPNAALSLGLKLHQLIYTVENNPLRLLNPENSEFARTLVLPVQSREGIGGLRVEALDFCKT
nr:hypothetical protein HmN_000882500 [Hymenolepis microstoma]